VREEAGADLGSDVDWGTQLRRGVIELCMLAIIERAPSYGYQIVTEMSAAPQLASGEGTIYPILRRLKHDGLVETFWKESDAGPPRQYYQLTPKGRTSLLAMRGEWGALVQAMDGYLQRNGAHHA
jgi:PadR family transcriptional regulator PadR